MSKRNKQELAKEIGAFLQQYRRKAEPGWDPNDRGYDRKVEQYLSRLKPEDLDEVLNGDKDERLPNSPNRS